MKAACHFIYENDDGERFITEPISSLTTAGVFELAANYYHDIDEENGRKELLRPFASDVDVGDSRSLVCSYATVAATRLQIHIGIESAGGIVSGIHASFREQDIQEKHHKWCEEYENVGDEGYYEFRTFVVDPISDPSTGVFATGVFATEEDSCQATEG